MGKFVTKSVREWQEDSAAKPSSKSKEGTLTIGTPLEDSLPITVAGTVYGGAEGPTFTSTSKQGSHHFYLGNEAPSLTFLPGTPCEMRMEAGKVTFKGRSVEGVEDLVQAMRELCLSGTVSQCGYEVSYLKGLVNAARTLHDTDEKLIRQSLEKVRSLERLVEEQNKVIASFRPSPQKEVVAMVESEPIKVYDEQGCCIKCWQQRPQHSGWCPLRS